MISCHPPIWEFEELYSHIVFLLLPHPAGRPAASRCMVLCKSTVSCEEAFALTQESLSVLLQVGQTVPRRLVPSHSKMAFGYGKDSTLNAELLNRRAQHVKCFACSLLRWGLRMYLSVRVEHNYAHLPLTLAALPSPTLLP